MKKILTIVFLTLFLGAFPFLIPAASAIETHNDVKITLPENTRMLFKYPDGTKEYVPKDEATRTLWNRYMEFDKPEMTAYVQKTVYLGGEYIYFVMTSDGWRCSFFAKPSKK
jgi:7-cyano-7-deazaguanine synthase in queuosine biosynthesis